RLWPRPSRHSPSTGTASPSRPRCRGASTRSAAAAAASTRRWTRRRRRSKPPTARCTHRRKSARKGERAPIGAGLGDDIRQELVLDLRDEILEVQLALLQALQLDLIERLALRDPRDDVVEVAMLGLELDEFAAQSGVLGIVHGTAILA